MERFPDETITLVTGATGFLGRHLVAALAGHLDGLPPAEHRRARRVHIVSRVADPRFDGVETGAVTTHQVDLTDAPAVEMLMQSVRPDELLHLAWFDGESTDRTADPAHFDWVAVSEHVIDAFARAGGRRAVTLGSCHEYGPGGGVRAEYGPVDPDTVYGRCKLDAGLRVLGIGSAYDHISVAVARVFFVLGRFGDPEGLVPGIVEQVLEGQPAELGVRGPRRDYLHAWDVALGLIALAESELNGFVNIGRGRAVEVEELALTIGHALGRPDLLWFGSRPRRRDDPEEFTADIARITKSTGWRPLLDLPAAVSDATTWWSQALSVPAER